MKYFFLTIFGLHSLLGHSQSKLDFGNVIGQDISTCNSKTDGKICKSKNELEISLTRAWLLIGKYETVRLQYNNAKWKATKLERDWTNNTFLKYALKPVDSFAKIIADLKKNNAFTLPDQKDLKYEGTVDDGTEYWLTFKADTKFRSYEFQNPDIYLIANKGVKEFQYYVNIVSILFDQLKHSVDNKASPTIDSTN